MAPIGGEHQGWLLEKRNLVRSGQWVLGVKTELTCGMVGREGSEFFLGKRVGPASKLGASAMLDGRGGSQGCTQERGIVRMSFMNYLQVFGVGGILHLLQS